MKKFMKALVGASLIAIAATSASAQEKLIKLGTMTWENLVPSALVSKSLLESRGYTVTLTEFSDWGIAYAALARGDVQVLASQVDYAAADSWNKNMNQLEKISIVSHGLQQSLAVPSYMDIDSIDELNAHAEELGEKIIGIEPGSGLMRESARAIEEYNLDFTLVDGSTGAMTAALKAAVDRQEPIVVTLWTPTWMALKYDMKFLADPKGVFAPPQSDNLIAQKGFSEAFPEAREILAGIFIPTEDIARMTQEVSEGSTMEEAVNRWMEQNSGLMDRWKSVKSY